MDPISQEDNPFFEKPKTTKKTNSWVVDVLQSIVVALFVIIIIYLFIAIPNQVSGPSMMPNFLDGELLLTSKVNQWLGGTSLGSSLGLDYQRGDVIVFQKPGHRDLIKRVIGLPGESVMILDGEVYVNNTLIEEDYIAPEIRTNPGSYAREGDIITLKSDEYFVIGDNRNNSQDSRFAEYGPVKREWMKGKVIIRYLPLDRFGLIGTGKIEFAQ